MVDSSKDKKWLVKNNNRIIGPFSEEELQLELAKDYMSPFATASVPEQPFWGFIAAYPDLVCHTDITKLTQFTNTLHTNFEKTHKVIFDHISNKYSESEIASVTAKFPKPKRKGKALSKNNTTEPLVEEQKKKANFFLVAVCLVIVSVAVFIWYNKQKSLPLESPKSKLARNWFLAGDYSKAFQIWKNQKNQLSSSDFLSFQILKFQLKDDLTKGRELMSLKDKENLNQETKSMIQALTALKSGDLNLGRKTLSEILSSQASLDLKKASFANLALLAVKTRFCDFFERYQESQFGNKNLIHFAFALCLLQSDMSTEPNQISPAQISQTQKIQANLNQAKLLLEGIIQNPGDYYQEALVGLTYIKYLTKEDNLSSLVKVLLDSNPYLTESYWRNVFIDRKIYSWSELLPLCEKIYSSKSDDILFTTFYAYCLVRANRYDLAKQFMEKASLKLKKSALVKALHAYISDFLNLKNESVMLLGSAIESNSRTQYSLPYILQAKFCEQKKNWDCALKNWHIVLKRKPESVSGLGGIAYVKYSQGLYEEAREYMTRGFAIDNFKNYSPLLFVKASLENEKLSK